MFSGNKDGGRNHASQLQVLAASWSREEHLGSLLGGLGGQSVSPRSGSRTHGFRSGRLLPSLAPVLWSSRHSGALASLSQGPRVSGENRSLEEQSSEPAQALNVISSSLNRIGTGAKELAGPPSGSQLSRPGAYLDGCWLPRLHLFPVGEGWDSGLWQVGSPCKSLISSWEMSQAKMVC